MARTRSAPTPEARVDRATVLRFRHRRHGLHHPHGALRGPDDLALLDVGVQDTGHVGAAWALANRGLDLAADDDRLVYAWTLRGAPHAYRRADAAAVALATAPFSESDAAKRVFDGSKPLRAAGIPVLDALATVAGHMRTLSTRPISKGDLSSALRERLDEPYLRYCRPCDAIHLYEQTFRLSALQAGLELQPGTSPPVLARIPKLKPLAFSKPGTDADPRFDVVRGHLRVYGPSAPRVVAEFLDSTVTDVTAHWPDDVVDVEVRGHGTVQLLAEDLDELLDLADAEAPPTEVRLLGPYDPYLQLRDRELLVADQARRKHLWRVLGRPGAVVDGRGEVTATWRPTTSGSRFTVAVEPWVRPTKALKAAIEQEAERLAMHKGLRLAAVDVA
jgi:hypothetical protein